MRSGKVFVNGEDVLLIGGVVDGRVGWIIVIWPGLVVEQRRALPVAKGDGE